MAVASPTLVRGAADPVTRGSSWAIAVVSLVVVAGGGVAWVAGAFDGGASRIKRIGGPGSAAVPSASVPPVRAPPGAERREAAAEPPLGGAPEDALETSGRRAARFVAQPLVLHVVAAESGAPLRAVTVSTLVIPSFDRHASVELPLVHATRWAVLHERRDAPIELSRPAESGRRLGTLEVAVDGREPARLRVDWTSGGERRVALRAAGGVAVRLAGAPATARICWRAFEITPQREAVLAARDAAGQGAVLGSLDAQRERAADAPGPVAWTDLVPGRCRWSRAVEPSRSRRSGSTIRRSCRRRRRPWSSRSDADSES